MSDFLDVLNERTSAEHFESGTSISVPEIDQLIVEACQAPSAFNIQHWRFIAVTDERIREKLKATTIGSNQERVAKAPLVLLILGDLDGYEKLGDILDEAMHAGLLSRKVADVWLTMANGMYRADRRLARDEAIRSGSLAAMTFMLAAGNRGYVSCPIGFNPVQVMEILGISDRYVPVMMLTVGRPASGNNARRPRLPQIKFLRSTPDSIDEGTSPSRCSILTALVRPYSDPNTSPAAIDCRTSSAVRQDPQVTMIS